MILDEAHHIVEECLMLMIMYDHFVLANPTFSLLEYYFIDNRATLVFLSMKWVGLRWKKI
jgi:hypothetical protein